MEVKTSPDPKRNTLRWLLISLLQVVVFGILIYFLYKNFDLPSFVDILASSHKPILALTLLFFLIRELIFGLRWWNSVGLYKGQIKGSYFIKGAYIVRFFDYMLPIPAADDFYKLVLLRMKRFPVSNAIASIAFDKVFGFIVLGVLFFCSVPLLLRQTLFTDEQLYLVIVAVAIVLAPMLFLALKPATILQMIDWLGKKLFPKKYTTADEDHSTESATATRAALALHLMLVITFNLVSAAMIFLLFRSLDQHMEFIYILVCVPLFTFSGILPLSYQGIGLYEAAMTFVFINFFKADATVVQSMSILHLSFSLVTLSLGGLLAIPHFKEYISAFKSSISLLR